MRAENVKWSRISLTILNSDSKSAQKEVRVSLAGGASFFQWETHFPNSSD